MSNILSIRRRLQGDPGPPDSLAPSELAFNQVDSTLYYGFSSLDNNDVTAVAIAGPGAFVTRAGASQTISSEKTFNAKVTFNGDIEFNNPVSFRNSDFNFGNFVSYLSLSSVGTTTLSATNFLTDVDFGGNRLINVATPLSATDAANKAYVEAAVANMAQGINVHNSVKVATTPTTVLGDYLTDVNTPLSGIFLDELTVFNVTQFYGSGTDTIGLSAIDGVDLGISDRVLVKDASDKTQNGVYTVKAVNVFDETLTLVRAADYNQSSTGEIKAGDFMFVGSGVLNANKGFVLNSVGSGLDHTVQLNVDALNYTQFSGAGQITYVNGLSSSEGNVGLTDIAVPDTYYKVTVNSQGRVTSGEKPNSLIGLAAATLASRQLPLYTANNSVCAINVSEFGEALLNTTANQLSATLGLADMAFQYSNNVTITGGTISGLTIQNSVIDLGTF